MARGNNSNKVVEAMSNATQSVNHAVGSHSFTTVITIIIVLYILFLAPGTIPRLVSDIFTSTLGKLLAIIVVALVAYRNPLAGIMLAIGVALTVMVANENRYLEKMANMEEGLEGAPIDEEDEMKVEDAMPVDANPMINNNELTTYKGGVASAESKTEKHDDEVNEIDAQGANSLSARPWEI